MVLIILFIFIACRKENENEDNSISGIRYRGFNLLGKFDVNDRNNGYSEDDFKMIHEFGFNFVRLPIDYRTYTEAGNWYNYQESGLSDIDNAVNWGKIYNVHININLHRAPGYCVNKVSGFPDILWTDTAAQRAFIAHWVIFAKRYKDIPSKSLSFNLVNEPTEVSNVVYSALMKKVIDTVHSITPDRYIYIDGIECATEFLSEFVGYKNVIQSFHNYKPVNITHYKAPWVDGSDLWPIPQWPVYDIPNGLYGDWKPDLTAPFNIQGIFLKNTRVTINVLQVSIKANFNITLDSTLLYSHLFEPKSGTGEWTRVISTQWGYQNIYCRDYSVNLPKDGKTLSFYISEGDWLTFNSIKLVSGNDSIQIIPGNFDYGVKPITINVDASGNISSTDGKSLIMASPLIDTWANFSKTNNAPVMIGEMGVYNQTPHDVTLRYLEDMLKMLKNNNIGFAFWEFRGSFGILDSERKDVQYENYNGYKLDRRMLELIQKY